MVLVLAVVRLVILGACLVLVIYSIGKAREAKRNLEEIEANMKRISQSLRAREKSGGNGGVSQKQKQNNEGG